MKEDKNIYFSGPMIVPARQFFDIKKKLPASIILSYQMKEWQYTLSKMTHVEKLPPEQIKAVAFQIPELTPNGSEVLAFPICRSADPNEVCIPIFGLGGFPEGREIIGCHCYRFPDVPEEPREKEPTKIDKPACQMGLRKSKFGDYFIPAFDCIGECKKPLSCTLVFSQISTLFFIGCVCRKDFE
ncbi:MAG: hypothetical protein ACFE95_23125 [Candidatus Hodarchaeota archaeon]